MALTRETMTDEQRKSVVLDYLKAFDNAGVIPTGGSILDLFADDAQVYFPKWGLATGKEQISKLFTDVGTTIKHIEHHYAHFNWVFSGGDIVVCEGTSHGEHQDGAWRAGVPEWGAGRWCDVFEIRDWKIQRVFIYLDPDYVVLGISLLGYVSAAAQGGSVMPIVYAATGLGVLITTIWAAALGQTFVAAVFGAFTGFWLSYAAFVLGLAHNWYVIPQAQVAHSVAQFLIAWAIVIFMLDVVSVYVPSSFTMILSSALVAVVLLIIANLNGSTVLPKVAGGFILLFSAVGFYDFLATGIESVGGRPLSLGPPLRTLLARK